MTEEKNPHYVNVEAAKEMICPIIHDDERTIKCQGPKCMAWRWQMFDKTPHRSEATYEYSKHYGYCGVVRP